MHANESCARADSGVRMHDVIARVFFLCFAHVLVQLQLQLQLQSMCACVCMHTLRIRIRLIFRYASTFSRMVQIPDTTGCCVCVCVYMCVCVWVGVGVGVGVGVCSCARIYAETDCFAILSSTLILMHAAAVARAPHTSIHQYKQTKKTKKTKKTKNTLMIKRADCTCTRTRAHKQTKASRC
jgi:hypothetical protein